MRNGKAKHCKVHCRAHALLSIENKTTILQENACTFSLNAGQKDEHLCLLNGQGSKNALIDPHGHAPTVERPLIFSIELKTAPVCSC